MTNYVLEGLVKRRAQLAGDIERAHEALRKMVVDLEVLDAAILQFDPAFPVESIKPKGFRPPSDWAHRGEMSRLVLNIIRQAAEPMTARDIAIEMLISRALDKSDQRLLKIMAKRVGVALRIQRERGLVRSLPGPGQFVLWEVAR